MLRLTPLARTRGSNRPEHFAQRLRTHESNAEHHYARSSNVPFFSALPKRVPQVEHGVSLCRPGDGPLSSAEYWNCHCTKRSISSSLQRARGLSDLCTTCPLTGLRRYPYLGTHFCTVMSMSPYATACWPNDVLAHPCAFW